MHTCWYSFKASILAKQTILTLGKQTVQKKRNVQFYHRLLQMTSDTAHLVYNEVGRKPRNPTKVYLLQTPD